MKDPSGEFFTDLVQHHISGQLKVAPEHCVAHTLDYMGKPHIEVYEKFREEVLQAKPPVRKDQYLVPYLISSHPGCTLEDAVQLAEWLNKQGHMPEQGPGLLPHSGHPGHLHVVHRPGPPDHEAGVRPQDPSR